MIFGFQIDLARRLERPDALVEKLRTMGECGYNLCMLYLEDAFIYKTHPGISRRNSLAVEDMSKIYEACREAGMEVVPVIPALGHCGYITDKKGYEVYDEGFGADKKMGTLRYGEEKTYKLLTELFQDWCDNFPGTYLHVGLDESPSMGQTFIRKHGIDKFNAAEAFAEHCGKLNSIVKALGRKMVMWGDMLYHFPAAADLMEKDIIVADWYYYSFDRSPKVEAFNFADIDLSGNLKEKGFEVWGIPSVWPNMPIGDIKDRLENLKAWLRYGGERNIDGIVNTDWENSFGFYSISDLLFRTFGEMYKSDFSVSLEDALKGAVEKIAGCRVSDSFVNDLLALGKFHICGHGNRTALRRSLLSRISTQKARLDEYRSKTEQLENMFGNIDELLNVASDTELLKAIKLSHLMLLLFWKTGNDLSSVYSLSQGSPDKLESLKKMHREFLAEYMELWHALRFEDDAIPVRDWSLNIINELEQLIGELKSASFQESGMATVPRLELELECRRPALPVLNIAIKYSDGELQSDGAIMIKFESEYAVTDKTWRQHPVIPLDRKEMPEKIEFISRYYGQVGIVNAWIIHRGKRFELACAGTQGENINERDGILWLGPVCAAASDPTQRINQDSAVYRIKTSPAGNKGAKVLP